MKRIQDDNVTVIATTTGPSCSKLTMSLVNDSLKFQMAVLQIQLLFFVEKMSESSAVQRILTFFQQKIIVYLLLLLIFA